MGVKEEGCDVDARVGVELVITFRAAQIFVAKHFEAGLEFWHLRFLPMRRQLRIVDNAAFPILLVRW